MSTSADQSDAQPAATGALGGVFLWSSNDQIWFLLVLSAAWCHPEEGGTPKRALQPSLQRPQHHVRPSTPCVHRSMAPARLGLSPSSLPGWAPTCDETSVAGRPSRMCDPLPLVVFGVRARPGRRQEKAAEVGHTPFWETRLGPHPTSLQSVGRGGL